MAWRDRANRATGSGAIRDSGHPGRSMTPPIPHADGTVLRDVLPDPLRMQYRAALAELVRETVRERLPIDREGQQKLGQGIVEAAAMDAVVAVAIHELYKLHEGNIAHFGLRLSEYRSWAEKVRR